MRWCWGVLLWIGVLLAQALTIEEVVSFVQGGWPNQGRVIPGLSSIYNINISGPYAWALGLQDAHGQMAVAFFNGQTWSSGVSIPNLSGISGVLPLYQAGERPEALALDPLGHVAFFDGQAWQPGISISGLAGISLLSSQGHVFAVSVQAPVQSSYFDSLHNTWSMPVSLADKMTSVRAMAVSNGYVYLLGLDVDGQVVLAWSRDNQVWLTQGFAMLRPQNMQIVAAGTDVLVALTKDNQNLFSYSRDQGNTWQEASWPQGLLFTAIYQGIVWLRNESELGYFDLNEAKPDWHLFSYPAGIGKVAFFSTPALDGSAVCLVAKQHGPHIFCFERQEELWQELDGVAKIATHFDDLISLNHQALVGIGADAQAQAALFYYNGATWQVAHVQGLLAMVQNLYFSGDPNGLWAVGSN